MKRVMALDVGDVRIGIALSDPMRIIASPYETYTTREREGDLQYIVSLATEKEVDTVIVGLPLNMDGTESQQTQKVREFACELESKFEGDVKVKFIDERLTSVSAERILLEGDMSRKQRKVTIDKIAASIILESYLKMI